MIWSRRGIITTYQCFSLHNEYPAVNEQMQSIVLRPLKTIRRLDANVIALFSILSILSLLLLYFSDLTTNPGPLGPNPLALGGKRRVVLLVEARDLC